MEGWGGAWRFGAGCGGLWRAVEGMLPHLHCAFPPVTFLETVSFECVSCFHRALAATRRTDTNTIKEVLLFPAMKPEQEAGGGAAKAPAPPAAAAAAAE